MCKNEQTDFLKKFYQESKQELQQKSDTDVVKRFNCEVNCKGWTGTRGAFLRALNEVIIERWGESDWCDGSGTSLKYELELLDDDSIKRLDEVRKRL